MNILIPKAEPFERLSEPGVTFVPYARQGPLPAQAGGVVLWGVPAERRRELFAVPGLKWALTLTAGVDHVLPDLPPGVDLYNASALHDDAVAQHALAGLLAVSRGLHLARDAQARGEWGRPRDLFTWRDRHVVIWGFGHIGRLLEGMLAPLSARVSGVRSQTPPAERDALLAGADAVVLLLPATPETAGIVNTAMLVKFKKGAWLANFGRGELVVTADLVAALEAGQLGGAILDVTDPEPLPADSPLWKLPNVVITPHVASATGDVLSRAADFTKDFLDKLLAGQFLDNKVETDKGY